MLTKIQNKFSEKYYSIQSQKLLLAISGGIDSMVLLNLMKKSTLNISVAHCNFNLRGEESNQDEVFVTNYCQKNNIPCFINSFETEKYASDKKVSIQVAARELRYDWFFELKEKHQFDYIVTAHHLDDSIETFFINLSRGTGIEGLLGIRENENIIRPLLDFSRDEIEKYALENNIEWREDASNQSDKYLRNNIRHNIVPLFKELNFDFLNSFSKTIHHLQEVQSFSNEASYKILKELLIKDENHTSLSLKKLLNYTNYKFILYKWLSEYNFTAWTDIYNLIDSQSGKFIEAEKFRLLKNRNELILYEKSKIDFNQNYFISEDMTEIDFPIKLNFSETDTFSEKENPQHIYIDKNVLKFPLILGKYKEGEYFYPFGMQGKKKKVSKFFKDEKLSNLEKENTWILYSDNQIVWIIGMRQDDRFKITKNTTSIIKIEYLP